MFKEDREVGYQLVFQINCGRVSFGANQPDVESGAPSLLTRCRGWEEAGGKLGLEERVEYGNFISSCKKKERLNGFVLPPQKF